MTNANHYIKTAPLHAVQQTAPFVVASLEGPVQGAAGDYLATGVDGEQWPIRRETFERTYTAVAGQPDTYRKSETVQATPMTDAFTVATSHGILQGKAGDYLVEGTSGSRWIVDKDIFERTHTAVEE